MAIRDKVCRTIPQSPVNSPAWPWEVDLPKREFAADVKWPKISIVTPSFNQGIYIEETIRSVLLQGYPSLQFIIIDGGSTDETVAIIEKYEPWIDFWVSEKDSGQSDAINKGLARCTGHIFNWLNSDDTYLPGTLHEVALQFLNNPDSIFVSGFQNHIYIDGSTVLWPGTYLEPTLPQTIETCEVTQPSTFFLLSAIKKIGGVSEELHYLMDADLWLRLLLAFGQDRFHKIDKPLVNFRFHANSKTVSNAVENNFLIERCSIVSDLQRVVGLPSYMIEYFINKVYRSPKTLKINRQWEFNDLIISPKKLRVYFIKRYITEQFKRKNFEDAKSGVKELTRNKKIDFFLMKSVAKLCLKR